MKNLAEGETLVSITFIPSVDDLLEITRAVGSASGHPRYAIYASYAFLFLNAICFPAYLAFSDYWTIALIVFSVNLLLISFLIPGAEKLAARSDYKTLISENVLKMPCTIELRTDGILSIYNGNIYLTAWENIAAVQDNPDSVYFFAKSHGVAVRKSGFKSSDEQKKFMNIASLIRSMRKHSPNYA